MSASPSPLCSPTIHISQKTRPIWCFRHRGTAGLLQADEAPGEFAPGRSTEPAIVRKGYGDVDAAFRSAHAIVEATLSIGRHSGVPIETRGAIARHDAARDVLEFYGAAKVPHWNSDQIARMLGRGASSVHLYEGHVGGGFGIRGELYPEDVLVCVAALRMRGRSNGSRIGASI